MNGPPDAVFEGAVLAGGGSTRMGRDKAFVAVDGVPMVARVAAALIAAGTDRVVTIGGDRPQLEGLGLTGIADLYAGEGPLGGVITALGAATSPLVVIVACDMPWLESRHIVQLVDALAAKPDLDVAVGAANGVMQPLFAVWRVSALERVKAMFDEGERAPRRAIAALRHVSLELGGGSWSTDVDTPDALGTPEALGTPGAGRLDREA
jgi:molybdopterin-guanine dinucleotide biosynthesis protein A